MKPLKEVDAFVYTDTEGNETAYVNTGKTTQAYGNTYYAFCKMKNQEELSPWDIWKISEPYFNEMVAKGRIRVVERFGDL